MPYEPRSTGIETWAFKHRAAVKVAGIILVLLGLTFAAWQFVSGEVSRGMAWVGVASSGGVFLISARARRPPKD